MQVPEVLLDVDTDELALMISKGITEIAWGQSRFLLLFESPLRAVSDVFDYDDTRDGRKRSRGDYPLGSVLFCRLAGQMLARAP